MNTNIGDYRRWVDQDYNKQAQNWVRGPSMGIERVVYSVGCLGYDSLRAFAEVVVGVGSAVIFDKEKRSHHFSLGISYGKEIHHDILNIAAGIAQTVPILGVVATKIYCFVCKRLSLRDKKDFFSHKSIFTQSEGFFNDGYGNNLEKKKREFIELVFQRLKIIDKGALIVDKDLTQQDAALYWYKEVLKVNSKDSLIIVSYQIQNFFIEIYLEVREGSNVLVFKQIFYGQDCLRGEIKNLLDLSEDKDVCQEFSDLCRLPFPLTARTIVEQRKSLEETLAKGAVSFIEAPVVGLRRVITFGCYALLHVARIIQQIVRFSFSLITLNRLQMNFHVKKGMFYLKESVLSLTNVVTGLFEMTPILGVCLTRLKNYFLKNDDECEDFLHIRDAYADELSEKATNLLKGSFYRAKQFLIFSGYLLNDILESVYSIGLAVLSLVSLRSNEDGEIIWNKDKCIDLLGEAFLRVKVISLIDIRNIIKGAVGSIPLLGAICLHIYGYLFEKVSSMLPRIDASDKYADTTFNLRDFNNQFDLEYKSVLTLPFTGLKRVVTYGMYFIEDLVRAISYISMGVLSALFFSKDEDTLKLLFKKGFFNGSVIFLDVLVITKGAFEIVPVLGPLALKITDFALRNA